MTVHRGSRATLRIALLRMARKAYRRLGRSPLRGLLSTGPIRRLRAGLQVMIAVEDVLEIFAALEGAGARLWLAGGWAADAVVGRQTRPHRDLDLLFDQAGEPAVLAVLAARGFAAIPDVASRVPGALLPDRLVLQDVRGRVVDLHPIDPATWPDAAGLRDAFAVGQLGGRSLPCLSREAQIAARRGYELEDDDHHDLALLTGSEAAASTT
jgi:lincosamide nucleotidyltransferase A/C/D/E